MAGQLARFQIAIYLFQEPLERLKAGVPPHALLDCRLLLTGVAVQTAIALALAVLLTLASRAAEAVGRALRGSSGRSERTGLPLPGLVVVWPSRLLAAGLGSRAPPRPLVAR